MRRCVLILFVRADGSRCGRCASLSFGAAAVGRVGRRAAFRRLTTLVVSVIVITVFALAVTIGGSGANLALCAGTCIGGSTAVTPACILFNFRKPQNVPSCP